MCQGAEWGVKWVLPISSPVFLSAPLEYISCWSGYISLSVFSLSLCVLWSLFPVTSMQCNFSVWLNPLPPAFLFYYTLIPLLFGPQFSSLLLPVRFLVPSLHVLFASSVAAHVQHPRGCLEYSRFQKSDPDIKICVQGICIDGLHKTCSSKPGLPVTLQSVLKSTWNEKLNVTFYI